MDEWGAHSDRLIALVEQTLRSAEAVTARMQDARQAEALRPRWDRGASVIEQALMRGATFSVTTVAELRALAVALEPAIRRDTPPESIADEDAVSGGQQLRLSAAQTTTLIALGAALNGLADHVASALRREQVTCKCNSDSDQRIPQILGNS